MVRILLMDDDPLTSQALAEAFRDAGHEVTESPLAPELFPDIPKLFPEIKLIVGIAPPALPGIVSIALVKPVRIGVLLARIKQEQSRPIGGSLTQIGPWRFAPEGRTLESEGGIRVRLTDKEAAILERLSQTKGVVSRATLLAEVWGYSGQMDTHTVETHVYRLRRKLERIPQATPLLLTEAGGYRLQLGEPTLPKSESILEDR